MCLNIIYLTCPVILVLRYVVAIRSSFIFASLLFALLFINMSVHAQEQYVHSSHHQFQSLAVASQTQLSSLCDEPQLWCLNNCARKFIYSIALVILLLSHQAITGCLY